MHFAKVQNLVKIRARESVFMYNIPFHKQNSQRNDLDVEKHRHKFIQHLCLDIACRILIIKSLLSIIYEAVRIWVVDGKFICQISPNMLVCNLF